MDRISKARLRCVHRLPFFGHLLAYASIQVVPGPGTACVSKNAHIKVFQELLDKETDEELAWTLCHEILHVALFCWDRQEGRKALIMSKSGQVTTLWNIAHDYALNMILEDFIPHSGGALKRPPNVCYDTKYAGMSAERIYDTLLSDIKGAQGDLPDDFEGDIMWDPDADGNGEASPLWKDRIKAAMDKQKGHGFCPDTLSKALSLGTNRINWVEELAQWIGTHRQDSYRTYTRPARRGGNVSSLLLPGNLKVRIPHIVFLWDTSGSMTEYVDQVFCELAGLCVAARAPLRVIVCDAAVHGDFTNVSDARTLIDSIKGGGGSDFTDAFALVEEPDNLIVAFTDGHITVPDGHVCNTVWVLTPDGINPTGGKWGSVIKLPVKG